MVEELHRIKNYRISCKILSCRVTTLLVSGENDNLADIENIAKFISSIDANIPLHLNRYFPNYKFDKPTTDKELMFKGQEIAMKYLKRVKLGNI